MKAIQISETGGPDVLRPENVSKSKPGPGEALVKLQASGVNFIDIYHRTGLYPLDLPFIPGSEGAGIVETVGEGVIDVKPGDRVAFAMQRGSYAEAITVPAWMLAPLPESVSFVDGAATMLQGMTAHYLACSTYPLENGHIALIHAAAGGVGGLLVQIAKLRGATVIATVSNKEKAEIARQAGADHIINYTEKNFADEVKTLTEGRGVDVVYDSVGVDTFEKSLASLKPRGMLVLYGQSSGPIPPVDLQTLNKHGSLFTTRPSLGHYIQDRDELLSRSGDLFRWIAAGQLNIRIDSVFPLKDAALAHERLAGRKALGKIVLEP